MRRRPPAGRDGVRRSAWAVPADDRRPALWVGGALLCLLGLLGVRIYWLQVRQGALWRGQATRQQTPVRKVAAYRGDIRTRDGAVLARSVRCRTAFAEPRRMGRRVKEGRRVRVLPPTAEDLRGAARRIAAALSWGPRDEQALFERLSNPARQAFCFVARRLPDDKARRLEAAGIRGIGFQTEYGRAYPHGELAAQLLGFTEATGEGTLKGKTGIEGGFDLYLRGVSGRREVVRDAGGKDLLSGGGLLVPPEDGARVTLTIDAYVQKVAEEAAGRIAKRWKPKGISVVCLEPSTGRILALASLPGYDPEHISDLPKGQFEKAIRNRPLMDVFEQGSTIKPFVMAQAITRGAVSRTQTFDCSKKLVVAGKLVTDVHHYGMLGVQMILAKSSNKGMVQVGLLLGPAGIRDALLGAGFGRPSGLGLKPEEPGKVRSLATWTRGTTRSVSQGYALQVTPIQLAAAFQVFANGGVRHDVQLIESIRDPQGRFVQRFAPRGAKRLFPADLIRDVLVPALTRVVEEGTAKYGVRMQRWSAAGKTGTAQKVVGGRYVNRYVSSFVGFAPAERPALLVLAMVDDAHSPDGRKPYGGTVGGPIVKEVFERVLPYLHVPPSKGR